MSLRALKESLKPCQNSSLPASTQTHSSSQIPRKPPKSSLAQQLLRLQDPVPRPPPPPVEKEDDEDEPEAPGCSGTGKVSSFQFGNAGPYEPLLLSSPGELTVIQVASTSERGSKVSLQNIQEQPYMEGFLEMISGRFQIFSYSCNRGLGKTIQTIAFLAAVFGKDGDRIDSTISKKSDIAERNPVLIVCPSSVIHNWESEFSKWSNFSVAVYHGANRDLIYDKLEARGVEILITSFDTYRICGSQLSGVNWEIVVVDEAHRLKNEKSKLYLACLEFRTLKRIGLTGTMMQNKIMELFNLFDWVEYFPLGSSFLKNSQSAEFA